MTYRSRRWIIACVAAAALISGCAGGGRPLPGPGEKADDVLPAVEQGSPVTDTSSSHRWAGADGGNVAYDSGTVRWTEDSATGIDEDEIYSQPTTRPAEDVDDTILMPVED